MLQIAHQQIGQQIIIKKVRCKMDHYIIHTVLLVIILLSVIAITCYHYTKHRSKLKKLIVVLKI